MTGVPPWIAFLCLSERDREKHTYWVQIYGYGLPVYNLITARDGLYGDVCTAAEKRECQRELGGILLGRVED